MGDTKVKHLTNLCLFLLPLTITYAVISSIGTTGNYYGAPSPIGVPYQGVPQANGK
jgi:hypothetical protein